MNIPTSQMIAVELKFKPWLYGWKIMLYVNGQYIDEEFIKDITNWHKHTEKLLEKI